MADETTKTAEKVSEETEAPKSKKTPAGEGEITPVEFAKAVDAHLKLDEGSTRPQVIYGYIRNNKEFQENCVVDRGEGVSPRQVIKLAPALAWIDAKEQRKAERAAKKASEEAEGKNAPKAQKPSNPNGNSNS